MPEPTTSIERITPDLVRRGAPLSPLVCTLSILENAGALEPGSMLLLYADELLRVEGERSG